MIVTCPECSTRYMIDPAVLGAEGRLVKCSKCDNSWVETPLEEAPPEADAPADAVQDTPGPEAAPEEEEVETAAEETVEEAPEPEDVPEDAPEDATEDESEAEPLDKFPDEFPDDSEDEPELEADSFDAASARRARRARTDEASRGSDKRGRVGAIMWTLLVIAVVGVLGAGFALRDTVIQMWPTAEQIYDMIGLEREPPGTGFDIRKVESKTSTVDDKKLLSVKGEISNISKDVRRVPRMQGQLFDKDGRELQRWTFTVPETKLLPGENVTFSTELKGPAEGAAKLTVKFTDWW